MNILVRGSFYRRFQEALTQAAPNARFALFEDRGEMLRLLPEADALYGKQDGYCNGCGIHFPYRNMTIDHIYPRSRGGADTVDNLQLLCHACNSAKGTGTQEELRRKLRERGVIK